MIDYGTDEFGVQIACEGVNIPLNQVQTFYQPAGNQQITAGPLGIKSLGPALVMVPTAGLRTGSNCQVVFRDEVVDKDGNRVCAPEGGDINATCTGAGVSIDFQTEALRLSASDPSEAQENVTLVDAGGTDKTLLVQFNAKVNPDSTGSFTLTENGATDRTGDLTVMIPDPADSSTVVNIVVTGGLVADATYLLTADTTTSDLYGGVLPQNVEVNFTAAPATP